MIKELWWRLALKTGTWRLIAFLTLGLISYFLTGSLALATSIAFADWLIKTVLYFIHEVVWSKSNIGRTITSPGRGAVVWFTGLSGAGKTTVADAVADRLRAQLHTVHRVDGDVARRTFSRDLGFSDEDRAENCKRAAHVSSYLKENSIVLSSFISPSLQMRDYVRRICGRDSETFIVHVNCPIEKCAERDPKGIYAKLKDGKLRGIPFTGMHEDAPYVAPENPDLVLHTHVDTIDQSVDRVIKMLKGRGCL